MLIEVFARAWVAVIQAVNLAVVTEWLSGGMVIGW
jgi:hypothetical protein